MKMIFFYSHPNEIRFLFVRFLNFARTQSFEVGQESGSVLCRIELHYGTVLGDAVSPSFPRNLVISNEKAIASANSPTVPLETIPI